MNEHNMFVTMIASHSVGTRRFTIILSILLILIVIAFGVNTWLVWRTIFMGNGVQTASSITLPANYCLPLDAQARLRLITEHPNDYIKCLEMVTNK
jgi:sRNA-binding regulator protein Hfq